MADDPYHLHFQGEHMRCLLTHCWQYFGILFSILWGIRSCRIFANATDGNRCLEKILWNYYYEFMLNFSCSFAGWFFLHVLALRTQFGYSSPDKIDLVLFLFALLGITGAMPQVLVKLPENLARYLGEKLDPGKK